MTDKKDLPKGWREVKLGEVCKLKNGYAFKSSEYKDEGIPIIRISDINDGVVSTEDAIRIEANKEYDDFVVYDNDILVAMSGATTGKFGIFKSKEVAYQNQRVGKFKILNKNILNNSFLLFLLHSLKRKIEKDAYGGAQPNISSGKIEAMEILIPPLPEQHTIVNKIEELFSDLDNGIENLKTAQQQLKIYKHSVLKWAFEGRLTNKNVKEGELPESWRLEKLVDVTDKITDGEHFRPKTQAIGIPFLSAKDVRDDGISFADPLFISEETAKKALQRCNPQRGDILIVSRGASVGRMCFVNTDTKFCLLGSVILIKTKKSVSSKYINYVLKSPFVNQKMIIVSGATAQQAIYLRDIKNISIPICDIEEQAYIVQEIESRLSVCDKIEETITTSLNQSESLRQSILKKAFEGKLLN